MTRLAVVLGVSSAMTLAAVAFVGLDGSWALAAFGEASLSLALLSQA